MISIGEMLNYWDNLSLRTTTLGTGWPTCSLLKISPKLWSQLKLQDTWVSCLIMVELQSLWRETSLLLKIKYRKLDINMSILKLDTFITAGHVLWIVLRLSLRKILMLMSTIKKCWKKARTTNYGYNISRKKTRIRSKLRVMPDSWNKRKI